MRSSIIGLAAMAALFALPEIASATDAGAVVGGATTGPNTTGTVIVEERPPATREQTCIQDSLGNRTCKEVVR